MRLLRALTPLAVAMAVAVLAPSALAAFPGTNGVLVIAPSHGSGLQLVDAHGHGLHTICTDPNLCGNPGAPHFSPNGQQIAFQDRRSGRAVVVDTDGTCLWCLLGTQLTAMKATTPAFESNAVTLGFGSGQNLYTTQLTGGSPVKLSTPTPGARGPISAAVWSHTGALAFVRAGAVWLVRRFHAPHRIEPGSQPAFSPDGSRLAFVHQGWIWALNLANGRLGRLVKGADPAYSPDGRGLAFIAHGANVYVVGARGGKPRLVPGVQARALDWQPLTPASGGRCSVPAGTTVLAQSAEAVVTYNPTTPQTPWYGCLQATGHRSPLLSLAGVPTGTNASLGQVQIAGRFVAYVLTTTDASMNCSHLVGETDLGSGAITTTYTQSCTASSRGIDSLGLDSSGFTAWRAHQQVATAQPLTGIACPSSTLCVATDGHGNVFSSTSPGTAGSWSVTKPAGALNDVRCPSTALCIGLSGGQIVTSTAPAAGTWSAPVTIDSAPLADVSCPTATYCAAVDDAGNVLSSTNPTGGSSAWHVAYSDGGSFLTGVSCPAANLCVAVGQNGETLAWHGTTWTPSTPAPESVYALLGVSCPATTLCVASDSAGNVLTEDPHVATPTWTVNHIAGESGFIYQPVCASTHLCVARDGSGNVLVATDPAATWTGTTLAGSLSGVSCERAATAPLCAASDTAGEVHVSSAPDTGAASWSTVAVDVPPCGACIAEQLFAHDDRAIQALDQVQPGPGNVLANVALGANSTVVSWTHAGARESYGLK